MIPGQFGPTNLVLSCVFKISVIRTMSCCGIPSVIHTTNGNSALIASSILAAATGGGGEGHLEGAREQILGINDDDPEAAVGHDPAPPW